MNIDIAELPSLGTEIAKNIFGTNLLLSFVGGSYAKGTAKKGSDIDILIVLRHPNYKKEKDFSYHFKELHHTYNLNYHHCGEIFDIKTLLHLFNLAEIVLKTAPYILETGCYHTDCILSIFRKGDVIIKFFEECKKAIYGDKELLEKLTKRAIKYFQYPLYKRVQTEKKKLKLKYDTELDRKIYDLYTEYEQKIIQEDYIDTPIGIGLGRWFGSTIQLPIEKMLMLPLMKQPNIYMRNLCPIQNLNSIEGIAFIKKQCLGCILLKEEEILL